MSVEITGLSKEVAKHIRKQTFPLKSDKELYVALKAKLTKKEMKILLGWLHGVSRSDVQRQLKLDEERYTALSASLIKKLNNEQIKQAICLAVQP